MQKFDGVITDKYGGKWLKVLAIKKGRANRFFKDQKVLTVISYLWHTLYNRII